MNINDLSNRPHNLLVYHVHRNKPSRDNKPNPNPNPNPNP